MSGTVTQTGLEKEKRHLSVQGRQDQIHPSEDPSATSLHTPYFVNSVEVITTLDDNSSQGSDKKFSNGEARLGSWREKRADGSWKCMWRDGIVYEGELWKGMELGEGRMTWPSGTIYEGNFLNGCLHGLGTYTGADGATYTGNWIMNSKHGFGEKRYANGDHYKGFWSQGRRDGHGTYMWATGNVYTGDWKTDVMCGKGKLTWSNGDSFEGQWSEGKAHGHGVYLWSDSRCYVGTWSRGEKDGKGTFYPSGAELPKYIGLLHGSFSASDWEEGSGSRRHSFGFGSTPSSDVGKTGAHNVQKSRHSTSSRDYLRKSESLPVKSAALERRWSLEGTLEKLIGLGVGHAALTILEDDEVNHEEPRVPILEREYAQGVLINELVKEPLSKRARRRLRRQAKEIKKPGEAIIKGHRSYDLMCNLQLGIRYSVGNSSEPQSEINLSDFGHRARIWMRFPKEGSSLTPCHHSVDFRWKDYCPMVFRKLREMFKIDAADFMMSICGNDALRELLSPGKSGSIFFLSNDDRYMIKTLRKTELKVLLKMLRSYYDHVCKYENTLITKFFGLYRIKLVGGHKVRFVVMGNVFCTELRIHRRFDLKGSSLGRSTENIKIDETTTLKDLDLDFTFHLEPSWREALIKQVQDDCNFLQWQQIMDYSLLLGLHFRAPQCTELMMRSKLSDGARISTVDDDESGTYPGGLVLVAHEPNDSTSGLHIRGSSLRAAVAGHEQVDLLLRGTARLRIQLGVNMPARADRKPRVVDTSKSSETEVSGEAYDVVLCVGIIDILQEYNIVKKIEHAYKSLQFDSVSISAVDPRLYSQRFQAFLQEAFPMNTE